METLSEDVLANSRMSSVTPDIIRKKFPDFYDYVAQARDPDDIEFALVKQGLMRSSVPIALVHQGAGGADVAMAWIDDKPKHITSRAVIDRIHGLSESLELIRRLVFEIVSARTREVSHNRTRRR